ncbi:MAG: CvpA family protein [Oscillochloris sp.]|nr:CvpA family protein [Oscillochloris sp.]
MNDLDLSLLIGAGAFVLLGIYWGLIRQVLAIAGLIVGVAIAGRYGPDVAAWLSSFISDPGLAGIIGFMAVLMLVSTVASLAASLLRIFIGLLFLGWIDHLLGGVLGLTQAILAGATILVGMVTFPSAIWADALDGSKLAAGLVWVGQALTTLLPTAFSSAIRTFLGGA